MSDEVEGGNEVDEFGQLDDFFVDGAEDSTDVAEDVPDEVDAEVEAEAPEVGADVEAEAGDDPVEPSEAEVSKPDTSALMDKELQKIQQLRATLERDVAAAQANPTAETIKRAEATKSRLDAIIESSDDVDPYKAAVTLAQEGKAHEAKLAELQKAVDTTAGMSSQQVAVMQSQMARLQFKLDHPSLADRYDELAQAAAAEVDAVIGQLPANPSREMREMIARLDGAAFQRLIEAEESKSQAENVPATEAPPQRKKPVATSPIKNKSGKSSKPEETEEQRTERLLSGLLG